jgi:hypothetical protein
MVTLNHAQESQTSETSAKLSQSGNIQQCGVTDILRLDWALLLPAHPMLCRSVDKDTLHTLDKKS